MSVSDKARYIADLLKNEKIVLMQTDTVLGLLCRGDNDDCVKKIEKIKHRNHPSFGFFIKDDLMADKYVYMNDLQRECYNKLFPGYFTIILRAKNNFIVSDNDAQKPENKNCGKIAERCFKFIENGIYTFGVRRPKNEFCLEMLQYVDFPVLATSANISGKLTPMKLDDVDLGIINSVDFVYYDDKNDYPCLNSTIVDISFLRSAKAKIIRKGSGDIEKVKSIVDIEL